MPFFTEYQAVTFLLILARVSGIFIASPIFESKTVPMRYKIGFSIIVALILFPVVAPVEQLPKTLPHLAFLCAGQALFGFFLGTCTAFVFAAIQVAGALMDTQIGFAMATLLDPSNRSPLTLLSYWFNWVALILFFAINGHHWLLLGIINSFKVIPVDQFVLTANFIEYMIRLFSNILPVAFHISIPMLISLLLLDIVMGFITKIAPALNIMIVGYPFKIGMGLIFLVSYFPFLIQIFIRYFDHLQKPLLQMFYM
ncbi:MAG: flagellar biosynthetic protein FliR [Firmicutes bacterium]|nr:flagellar biosynthetic protein FliR [Bacillota bacterium]